MLSYSNLLVTVAHTLKMKVIAEAKLKTNKISTDILACLLRADLIPKCYVWGKSSRCIQQVLRHRMFLLRLQTIVKNKILILLLDNRRSVDRFKVLTISLGQRGPAIPHLNMVYIVVTSAYYYNLYMDQIGKFWGVPLTEIRKKIDDFYVVTKYVDNDDFYKGGKKEVFTNNIDDLLERVFIKA
jgi:hypothetical protein